MSVVEKYYSKAITVFELEDDGFWTVSMDTVIGENSGNGVWNKRCLSVKSIDKDKNRAFATAQKSLVRKVEAVQGDLTLIPLKSSETEIKDPSIGEPVCLD